MNGRWKGVCINLVERILNSLHFRAEVNFFFSHRPREESVSGTFSRGAALGDEQSSGNKTGFSPHSATYHHEAEEAIPPLWASVSSSLKRGDQTTSPGRCGHRIRRDDVLPIRRGHRLEFSSVNLKADGNCSFMFALFHGYKYFKIHNYSEEKKILSVSRPRILISKIAFAKTASHIDKWLYIVTGRPFQLP